ncbi:hypothetical protein CVT25_002100 [Psilocybe cyanescens]|uniref:Uncharacterized protein n=1 Tax=Psilocybe cyanescens TaxID=93625 RepID=A0A409X9E6_PSICY|nr:hypothetical protein CVT25_002100 [Psilocybe cyanescens]
MASLLDQPLYLYSIPAVFVTAFYPGSLKFLKINNSVGYNNVAPRSNTPKNFQGKVTSGDAQLLDRMEGAHQNGNENTSIWYAAIIVGNIAGLDNRYLNTMALTYVATRLVYNTVYMHFNHLGSGWVRTALYFFGLSHPLRILFKAAGAVASRG